MTTNLSAHTPTDTPIPTGGETTASPITVTILDAATIFEGPETCLLYTSPSPRDATLSRMPSSA